ncbi:MAG: glycosyltransferase family 2 protein [Acidimicrobiia bacterium]|nr:glycosyltransferase family 2 protein [Acidimicrobiia bacterium]
MPSVSVVIPALNAADVIGNALMSIKNQTYQNIVEVIVAAGDAETASASRRFGAEVVENPSGTTPAGLNLGLGVARGSVIVRCDAHAALPSGYVSRAIETLLARGAVNVGGMQVPVGTTYWERAIASAMASPIGAGDARYRIGGEAGPAETVYLGVYDKKRILDLGGFDETFKRNQDYELNHRIIAEGGLVWFDPELRVEYKPRGSLRELWSQYFQYGAAKRQFARHHARSLRARQLAPPVLVLSLIISLLVAPFWTWSLLAPAGYVLALASGVVVKTSASDGASVGTILALTSMHLAWGLGFLFGKRLN